MTSWVTESRVEESGLAEPAGDDPERGERGIEAASGEVATAAGARPPVLTPTRVDWSRPLPEAWPDREPTWRLIWRLIRSPWARGGVAELPPGLPGPIVPDYARREFHGMPNGYYSQKVMSGYDLGFEIAMWGTVTRARKRMARVLATHAAASGGSRGRALDLGSGTGRLANELVAAGFGEVWGLDPSPYMLSLARRRSPQASFEVGLAERAPFADESFDAVGTCFLFHELPAVEARLALREAFRMLRPGGVLCITEPSRLQAAPPSRWWLLRKYGPFGLYFNLLARTADEPFVADWHAIEEPVAWLEDAGFEPLEEKVGVPFVELTARRPV